MVCGAIESEKILGIKELSLSIKGKQ